MSRSSSAHPGGERFDEGAGGLGSVRSVSRRRFLKLAGIAGASGSAAAMLPQARAVASAAGAIAGENQNPGTHDWESTRDRSIVGYTTDYSVLPGDTVTFKVNTPATAYVIRIFRLGWYQGKGARWLQDVKPSVPLPQIQPEPLTDEATGLTDCGNWEASARWIVPEDAASGVYYALLQRTDEQDGSNHVLFVVRREGPSDILVQTSEMTVQAYNTYGGNSLYFGEPVGRAYKVSYNRPSSEGAEDENDFFNAEYPLLRFLERNGYDVSYCGGIDVHRDSELLLDKKVFISSGHDEYVSKEQRAHVTAARDAGVNLIFMTGNEYFWKVRFEPAISADGTIDRTMVCYKETLANAKIDPSPEWTGTWRDPRFSPPSNGGAPENSLTGQLFRAILPTREIDMTMQVPSDYRDLRIWRHTDVASLETGAVRDLAPSTLGYEFDCDVDNGFRPPGTIRLSETEATVPQLLLDYGATYAVGTCLHQMTMYRAPSGALVWGTGTVQWSYGLDEEHACDYGTPTDPAMQQATVNVLADMGVQPATLMAGLVPASKSTDLLPPVVSIAYPADGSSVTIGAPVTITGSAIDTGGGVVAGVEVSTDGGETWHPAVGRDSWSYVWTPLALGELSVRVRATDDSCNIGQATVLTLNGAERPFPCGIWPDDFVPGTAATDDAGAVEVGVRFQARIDGFIRGIRFYKGEGNTGTHVGTLWSDSGEMLATATFVDETSAGWQTVKIDPIAVTKDRTYVASVFMPAGHYASDAGYFTTAFDLPPLRALADGEDGPNGVYRYGEAGFPTRTFGSANYWVDVVFSNDNDEVPTVVALSPANGLNAVAQTSSVEAVFSEALRPDSVEMEVRAGGVLIAGAVSYDAGTRTVTFSPAADFPSAAEVTASVITAQDAAGNPMAGRVDWTFTIDGPDGSSPATLWDTTAEPQTMETETSAVELGTRFRSAQDALVTALRFYLAPGSQGPHIGHLWGPDQSLLATVPFETTSARGWQQASLATPVPIEAGVDYVVSYHCPHGRYGSTSHYFAEAARVRAPLSAPSRHDGGGNGVYRYGISAYPVHSNGANYWADVVVVLPPDETPPAVVNLEPAPGLVAVGPGTTIEVTFSEPVLEETLQFTAASNGAPVSGTVALDGAGTCASFTPAAELSPGARYTATVMAEDLVGNELPEPAVWSFTAAKPEGESPATIWTSTAVPEIRANDDGDAVELGVRFRPQVSGTLTGLRYYRGPGNAGPHVGRVWTGTGELIATVAFEEETLTGWQQAMLTEPIEITAGMDYVASYHAPHGHYASSPGGLASAQGGPLLRSVASSSTSPNGVYVYGGGGFPTHSYNATNYWVDVIFEDRAAPEIAATSPSAAEAGVSTTTTVSATFDEGVDESTIEFSLKDGDGILLSGITTYDTDTSTVVFTPQEALDGGRVYTATIEGGIDLAGNPMAEPFSWSFTTAGQNELSLWPTNTVPATVLVDDAASIEVGVRLRADVPGRVVAIRFFKGGPKNAGPHVVHLWAEDGTSLASATLNSSTARGWQTVPFTVPVDLSPGVTYVASYFTPSGYYSSDVGYFNGGAHESVPLSAPANIGGVPNGLFTYSPEPAFPTAGYSGSNYWVDVVFVPDE